MKTIYLIFIFLILSTYLAATIINIPADQPTIQAGIDFAIDADTVLVQPGTYVENINYNGKNITVASLFLTTQDTSYISQSIIDGNQEDTVVRFENGENSTSILTGFTIINGDDYYNGGGITCSSSNPSLQNLTISDNSAAKGGGIQCKNYSNPSLSNLTIVNNIAEEGGGIYCENSSPTLVDLNIVDNYSLGFGGGIYCFNNSCPSLDNVMIVNNQASPHGGGIYCETNSNLILENVTIANNSGGYSGGGVFCHSSHPSLKNVTITNNLAVYGGGIYCETNSNPILINCILWNDTPEEIYFNDYGQPNSTTIFYSDIQGGEAGIVTNNNGTVNWLEGNINEDPLFVYPANGDYHLTANSPCIDAGDPSSPLDPDGTIADMGAFYFDQLNAVDNNEIPISEFNLSNHPNPFNPLTTISFDIKENETGILTLFNIKGQIIESQQFESGKHNYLWNASNQASGIYLYKLQTQILIETRKMLLLK